MCYWLIKETRCSVKKVFFAHRLQGFTAAVLQCLELPRSLSGSEKENVKTWGQCEPWLQNTSTAPAAWFQRCPSCGSCHWRHSSNSPLPSTAFRSSSWQLVPHQHPSIPTFPAAQDLLSSDPALSAFWRMWQELLSPGSPFPPAVGGGGCPLFAFPVGQEQHWIPLGSCFGNSFGKSFGKSSKPSIGRLLVQGILSSSRYQSSSDCRCRL